MANPLPLFVLHDSDCWLLDYDRDVVLESSGRVAGRVQAARPAPPSRLQLGRSLPPLSLRMAAISIPPSPQVLSTMTSRRVPLATVPNATNSPYRAVATAAGKRQRSYASDQRELAYGQPPPAKKQIIEVDDAESRRNPLLRGTGRNPPNAFTRKLEAIRDGKPAPKPVERVQKATSENLETIRQWQKHYRRAFPGFVFYFESIPEDARIKATRQIQALGAVRLS